MNPGTTPSNEDILVWPDGTWCYRYELSCMARLSDDYEVLVDGSSAYWRFLHLIDPTNEEPM